MPLSSDPRHNNTAEGRAMNRRVYAIITGNKSGTTVQTKDMNVQ